MFHEKDVSRQLVEIDLKMVRHDPGIQARRDKEFNKIANGMAYIVDVLQRNFASIVSLSAAAESLFDAKWTVKIMLAAASDVLVRDKQMAHA
jgi:hypothetical protein